MYNVHTYIKLHRIDPFSQSVSLISFHDPVIIFKF